MSVNITVKTARRTRTTDTERPNHSFTMTTDTCLCLDRNGPDPDRPMDLKIYRMITSVVFYMLMFTSFVKSEYTLIIILLFVCIAKLLVTLNIELTSKKNHIFVKIAMIINTITIICMYQPIMIQIVLKLNSMHNLSYDIERTESFGGFKKLTEITSDMSKMQILKKLSANPNYDKTSLLIDKKITYLYRAKIILAPEYINPTFTSNMSVKSTDMQSENMQ